MAVVEAQVVTCTPFTHDGKVDLQAVRQGTRFLVDGGIEVLIPCGNTGEFNSITLHESKELLEATLDEVGGEATVIASGGYSTKMAVELGRHAQAAGADAFMLHHPAHTFTSHEGLRALGSWLHGASRPSGSRRLRALPLTGIDSP